MEGLNFYKLLAESIIICLALEYFLGYMAGHSVYILSLSLAIRYVNPIL